MRHWAYLIGMAAALCEVWTDSGLAATTPNQSEKAMSLAEAGARAYRDGSYAVAEQLFREAVKIREASPSPPPLLASALNGLGASLQYQSRFADAENAYKQAIALYDTCAKCGEDRARTLINLVSLYREQHRLPEAQLCYGELRRTVETGVGGDAVAALFWNESGLFLRAKGDLQGAESALNKAASIWERRLPEGETTVILAWASLADLYFEMHNYIDAEKMFRKAAETCERAHSREDRRCAPSWNGLGLALSRRGATDEARRLLERAAAAFEKAYGPESPKVAAVLNNLGTLTARQKDYKTSDGYLSRAVDIWSHSYGPDHPNLASAYTNLAANAIHRSRWSEAESLYRKALDMDLRLLGPWHSQIGLDLNNLAVVYSHMKRYEDAKAHFERAIQVYERQGKPSEPALVSTLLSLANQQFLQKELQAARATYRRALEIEQNRPDDATSDAAVSFENYARLARKLADYAEAQKAETLAMRLRVRHAIVSDRLTRGQ